MNLVGEDFMEILRYLYQVWWPAREIVEKAIESRKEVSGNTTKFVKIIFLLFFQREYNIGKCLKSTLQEI